MQLRLFLNDFRKKAWKNVCLFLFMCLSVTMAATVVLMLTQLFSSLRTMYETAQPPHFLQMHSGALVQEDIDAFNERYDGVTAWQTVPMIDLYGETLTVQGTEKTFTLADCRLDISLVKQNEGLDVLLDAKRQPLRLSERQIGVPVILLEQYDIAIGDRITVCADGRTEEFTVAAYVYDGMMNSTMCSSTRFLISDGAFDALLGEIGETEYLIETWFTDSSLASAYQSAYEQHTPELPKNGQAITYTMIFLLSALTDLMTAMVFVLAGVVLLVIVVLCMRYVILAELEDDVREIGTMKSIGIPERGIARIYLSRIELLLSAACVCGFVFALLFSRVCQAHAVRMFGEQPLGAGSIAAAVCAVVLTAVVIRWSAGRILRRIRTRTITELLVRNDGFGKKRAARSRLYRTKHLPLDLSVALHEVRHGYGIVFWLLLLVAFLICVPMRTQQTMQDPLFVTYMGSPQCDILAEAVQGDAVEERAQALQSYLEELRADGMVKDVRTLRRVRLQALSASGERVGVHVDCGEGAGSGIAYLSGTHPVKETELALSALLAEELGKETGDIVTVTDGGQTYELVLCGIYQDVTSGGRTAKTVCAFSQAPAEKYTCQVQLTEAADAAAAADAMHSALSGGYSIESMSGFLDQTLGGVSARVAQAAGLVLLTGVLITVFLVILFMELRLVRSMPMLAEKLAMGIPHRAMLRQELYPMLLSGGSGALLGVLLAELCGEALISALFSMLGLGITRITFSPVTLRSPAVFLLLFSVLAVSTCVVCRKIRRINAAAYFNL